MKHTKKINKYFNQQKKQQVITKKLNNLLKVLQIILI